MKKIYKYYLSQPVAAKYFAQFLNAFGISVTSYNLYYIIDLTLDGAADKYAHNLDFPTNFNLDNYMSWHVIKSVSRME